MKTVIPPVSFRAMSVEAAFAKQQPDKFVHDDAAWFHFSEDVFSSNYRKWLRENYPAEVGEGRVNLKFVDALIGHYKQWRQTQPSIYEWNSNFYLFNVINPLDGEIELFVLEPSEVAEALNDIARPTQGCWRRLIATLVKYLKRR